MHHPVIGYLTLGVIDYQRAVHDAAVETTLGRLHGPVRRSGRQHLLSRHREE